jgi:hypothetical protein
MPRIKLKGGKEANLPVLSEREPAFTTDTKKFFVGSDEGNIELAKKTIVDNLIQLLQNDVEAKNSARIADIIALQGVVDTKNNARITDINEIATRLNNIVNNAGNSNIEIVDARGTFPVLRDRLETIESSVASKMAKTDILSMANMGQDIKEAMTGGSVAVVGTDAVDTLNVKNKAIIAEKTNFLSYYENLLNPTPKTIGAFWWYTDGVLAPKAQADNNAHERILLKSGVTYTIGSVRALTCFVTKLDGNTKITSLSATDGAQTITYTATEDCYLYVTLYSVSDPTKQAVINSNTLSPLGSNVYLQYGKKYSVTVHGVNISNVNDDVTKLKKDVYKNTITVKKDGTGNFTTITAAVNSITDSSALNEYNINIYPGTYDIMTELGSTYTSELLLPDYVNLIGIGKKESIIIKGEIPSVSATLTNTTQNSTVRIKQTNRLENLTITAKNLRYAVHDESSNSFKDWKRIIKNCDIIHYGNDVGMWGSTAAYGEGSSSGSISEFYDCLIKTYTNYCAYLSHNNTPFALPSYHKFVNCRVESENTTQGCMRFGSMGSGHVNIIDMIGCELSSYIYFIDETNTGNQNEYLIRGYGNEPIMWNEYFPNTTSLNNFKYEVKGLTKKVKNNTGSTITKGKPVMVDSRGYITQITADANNKLFFGVLMEDIATGESGTCAYGGYILPKVVGISGATKGTMYTLSNGTWVTTTDTNAAIFICSDVIAGVATFLKFIKR